MMEIPSKIKNKKYIVFGAVTLSSFCSFIMYLFGSTSTAPKHLSETRKVATANEIVDKQQVFIRKITTDSAEAAKQIEAAHKKIEESNQVILNLNNEIVQIKKEMLLQPEALVDKSKLDQLQERINYLELALMEKNTNANKSNNISMNSAKEPARVRGISRFVLASKKQSFKTPNDNIPAGSFVKAVLLGGVDAATSLNSANDPRPVLLRLVDKGTLPNRFRSDVCDCHVLGSAYGDLSSERVFIRLEKLSCVDKKTQAIVETGIAGYVSGEDGRAGVRGVVVTRDDALLRHAFAGGILGGVSRALSLANTSNRATTVTPIGISTLQNGKDALRSGTGEGVANALDRYAKYYIDRAEQLQPVIQVAAGRKVTIVFTQGTKFGDNTAQNDLEKTRLNSRQNELQNSQNNIGAGSYDSLNYNNQQERPLYVTE